MSVLCANCDTPLKYYSAKSVGEMLDVSPKTVREWANSGQLQGIKLGHGANDWKFRIDWVREFTDKRWGEING